MANIITFFFQGNFGSRVAAAKYAGPAGVTWLDQGGHRQWQATRAQAPTLLHNIHVYEDLHDVYYGPEWLQGVWVAPLLLAITIGLLVTLFRRKREGEWTWGRRGAAILALGLVLPVLYVSGMILTTRTLGWHLYDIDGPGYAVLFWRTNLAGPHDIERSYLRHFREMLASEDARGKRVVLFGMSRGAAATLVAVSQMNRTEHERIAFAVLQSPFDRAEHVFHERFHPLIAAPLHWAFAQLTSYDPEQHSPLDACEHFPLSVPVAFVTSEADRVVAPARTRPLIERLRERGHAELWHLDLETSSHSGMAVPDNRDTARYREFLEMLHIRYAS